MTPYSPAKLAELRALVKDAPDAKAALDKLQAATKLSRDRLRALSRQYGIYHGTKLPPVPQAAWRATVGDPTAARPIRRLFWDIEVSMNVVCSWRIGYKINLDPSNIIKERAIICIGYKWEGEPKTTVLRWDKDQDDKTMLATFLPVLASADEACAHHGDGFDLPWFRTRCLFHGLVPPVDIKTVDTCAWAKSKFNFNSNKLDYIARFLGIGAKIRTNYDLWKRVVLDKCPKALDEMCHYCGNGDVPLLEKVYLRMAPLMKVKTHAGVLNGGTNWSCPRTGSTNVKLSKTRVSSAGTLTYQMQNLTDGGYYSIGARAHAAYVEAKNGR